MINQSDALSHLFNAVQRDNVKYAKVVKEFATKKDNFQKGQRINITDLKAVDITQSAINMYKRQMPSLCHVRVDGYEGVIFLDKRDVVGFVNVNTEDGCIQALEVSEKYRGREIGTQLLTYAIIRLHAVRLSVNKKNDVALRLYKKYGFVVDEEDDHMYYMERG